VPRPDDPARGGRRRRSVTAGRWKPNVLAQFVAYLVTKSRLEPDFSTDLRLIAEAVFVANPHAKSKAIPCAEPDADTAAASLPHPVRIADPIAR